MKDDKKYITGTCCSGWHNCVHKPMPKPNDMPAFPLHYTVGSPYNAEGMTLRDYIAIHAPHEEVMNYLEYPKCMNWQEARYKYADAMLKAREEGTNNE